MRFKILKEQVPEEEKLLGLWTNRIIQDIEKQPSIHLSVENKLDKALEEFGKIGSSISRSEILYHTLVLYKERNGFIAPKLKDAFVDATTTLFTEKDGAIPPKLKDTCIEAIEEIIIQKIASEWIFDDDTSFYSLFKKYNRQLSTSPLDSKKIKEQVIKIKKENQLNQ